MAWQILVELALAPAESLEWQWLATMCCNVSSPSDRVLILLNIHLTTEEKAYEPKPIVNLYI